MWVRINMQALLPTHNIVWCSHVTVIPHSILKVHFCFPLAERISKTCYQQVWRTTFHAVPLKHQYFVYYALHLWYISTKFRCFKPPYSGIKIPTIFGAQWPLKIRCYLWWDKHTNFGVKFPPLFLQSSHGDQKRHGGWIQTVLDLVCTSDCTMNPISGLWSPRVLSFLTIVFGSKPIKGVESIDAWSWLSQLPGTIHRHVFLLTLLSM